MTYSVWGKNDMFDFFFAVEGHGSDVRPLELGTGLFFIGTSKSQVDVSVQVVYRVVSSLTFFS